MCTINFQPNVNNSLGGGLEYWQGFYVSVRLGNWKPLVNFDMSTTAFYKAMLVSDFVQEVLGDRYNYSRGLSDKDRLNLQKQLSGLLVTHTHLNPQRKHKIVSLSLSGVNREMFDYKGKRISVAQYFREKYNIQLRFPNLPCVIHRKDTKVPMECCMISPGQHCRRKLSEMQTATLIRSTAIQPDHRFEKLVNAAKATQQTVSNYMKEFEMSFDVKPVSKFY